MALGLLQQLGGAAIAGLRLAAFAPSPVEPGGQRGKVGEGLRPGPVLAVYCLGVERGTRRVETWFRQGGTPFPQHGIKALLALSAALFLLARGACQLNSPCVGDSFAERPELANAR